MIAIYVMATVYVLSLASSFYALFKLYSTKADILLLKKGWRTVLFHLILPMCLIYASEIVTKTRHASLYEGSELAGVFIGRMVSFFIFSTLFTYLFPWLISLIRKKESPNILGLFIMMIWLPVNIGSLMLLCQAF